MPATLTHRNPSANPAIPIENALRQSMVVGFTFADVLDALDSKVVVLNDEGCIVYANRVWFAGFPDSEMAVKWGVGADYLAVCDRAAKSGSGLSRQLATALREVLAGKLDEFAQDYPAHYGREKRWFSLKVSVFEASGKRFAALLHKDITALILAEKALERREQELQKMNARLQNLARTDALTGLSNRRGLMESLDNELSRMARFTSSLSLIMLDVDHFKGYNDSFGHPAGDLVLAQLGDLLREQVREVDTAARYGGEEFALLLPQTDLGGALALGERVRFAVESAEWAHRGVTVSVGVATLRKGGDVEGLIRDADDALYRSKKAGRNRVSLPEPYETMVQALIEK